MIPTANIFCLASSRKIARLKMFVCHWKKYRIFGNKCFSRHQIPVEIIHLIESQVTPNKVQLSIVLNVKKLIVLKIFSIKWST